MVNIPTPKELRRMMAELVLEKLEAAGKPEDIARIESLQSNILIALELLEAHPGMKWVN